MPPLPPLALVAKLASVALEAVTKPPVAPARPKKPAMKEKDEPLERTRGADASRTKSSDTACGAARSRGGRARELHSRCTAARGLAGCPCRPPGLVWVGGARRRTVVRAAVEAGAHAARAQHRLHLANERVAPRVHLRESAPMPRRQGCVVKAAALPPVRVP